MIDDIKPEREDWRSQGGPEHRFRSRFPVEFGGANVLGEKPMRASVRKPIVILAAVAMAFAGWVGPHHAHAAAHDTPAMQHASHEHGSDDRAHHRGHADVTGTHDHSPGAIADFAGQNCCVAWCSSIAFFDAIPVCPRPPLLQSRFDAADMRLRLAAAPALVDPPPR